MQELLQRICLKYKHAKLITVDYSSEMIQRMNRLLSVKRSIPLKNYRGAPIYSYLFGIYSANNKYVLHLDSDIMFGGGSQKWISEAIKLLESRSDVLTCSPLPGPPTKEGILLDQESVKESYLSLALRINSFSTRVFFINKNDFFSKLKLKFTMPKLKYVIKSFIDGNYPCDRLENIIWNAINRASLCRIDFLGGSPGLWSVHPPFRTKFFYKMLPDIIHRVETGNIPDKQCGKYDIDDSFFDWTEARRVIKSRQWWNLYNFFKYRVERKKNSL
jgi:hypothetical protein